MNKRGLQTPKEQVVRFELDQKGEYSLEMFKRKKEESDQDEIP